MFKKLIAVSMIALGYSGCLPAANPSGVSTVSTSNDSPQSPATGISPPPDSSSPTSANAIVDDDPAASNSPGVPTTPTATGSATGVADGVAPINVGGVGTTIDEGYLQQLPELGFLPSTADNWVQLGGPRDLPMIVVENATLVSAQFTRGELSRAEYMYLIEVGSDATPETTARLIADAAKGRYPSAIESISDGARGESGEIKWAEISLTTDGPNEPELAIRASFDDSLANLAEIRIIHSLSRAEPETGPSLVAPAFKNRITSALATTGIDAAQLSRYDVVWGWRDNTVSNSLSLDADWTDGTDFTTAVDTLQQRKGANVRDDDAGYAVIDFGDELIVQIFNTDDSDEASTSAQLSLANPVIE